MEFAIILPNLLQIWLKYFRKNNVILPAHLAKESIETEGNLRDKGRLENYKLLSFYKMVDQILMVNIDV